MNKIKKSILEKKEYKSNFININNNNNRKNIVYIKK